METLRQEMDRLVDRFFEPRWDEFVAAREWAPKLDFSETKDAYLVKLEVPGVEQKDLNVAIQDQMLTIKGEKHKEKEEKDERYHRVERSWGAFTRTLALPTGVDTEKVAASRIGPAVTTCARGRVEAMNRELMDEFTRRLRDERGELCRTVAQTDEELATLEVHQPGSPGEDVNTDLATAILSRLEGQGKHELDEIDAAQARLAAGTYGVCEGCGQPIPLTRLRALPTARYCVACQLQHER